MAVRSSNTLNKLWGHIVNEVFKNSGVANPNKPIHRSVHYGINQGFEELALEERVETTSVYALPDGTTIASLPLTEVFRAVIEVGEGEERTVDSEMVHNYGLIPSEGAGRLISHSYNLTAMQDIFPDLQDGETPHNVYVNDDGEFILTFRRDLIPTDLAQAENLVLEVQAGIDDETIEYRHVRQLSGYLPFDYQAGSIRVSQVGSWEDYDTRQLTVLLHQFSDIADGTVSQAFRMRVPVVQTGGNYGTVPGDNESFRMVQPIPVVFTPDFWGADPTPPSYQWTSNGGGVFSDPTSLHSRWTPPDVSADTTITLTLTVMDSDGATHTDTVDILVEAS